MATHETHIISGLGVSTGIGIGVPVIISDMDLSYSVCPAENIESEKARLNKAIDTYSERTNKRAEKVEARLGKTEADILRGHIQMISDPYMTGEMLRLIEAGECAEEALSRICNQFAGLFEASGDELTIARAADVRDIRDGILGILLGRESVALEDIPAGSVLVIHELTASAASRLDPRHVNAIISETGGTTSHSAILARALGIPAVMSVPSACSILADVRELIVNGVAGEIICNPTLTELDEAEAEQSRHTLEKAELALYRGQPTRTHDGRSVILAANIGNAEQADLAFSNDAEGIGLFRSEFLFMDTDCAPSEDIQYEAYRRVALAMEGKPVIIRTLDVGGDKEIEYLGMAKEDNPFLGLRAVRYCVNHPALFKTQLRALLRASVHGDIRIMLPMVSCVEEIQSIQLLLDECANELEAEGMEYRDDVPLGIMIETPATVFMADVFAREVDFFSIGTNDLTGYIMACDRGNDDVAHLYSPYNPAVLRAIAQVIRAGKEAGIMVGMCGEAASEKALIPLWLGMGLDEFSVSPSAVLATRREIARWDSEQATALAEQALTCTSEAEVRSLLI